MRVTEGFVPLGVTRILMYSNPLKPTSRLEAYPRDWLIRGRVRILLGALEGGDTLILLKCVWVVKVAFLLGFGSNTKTTGPDPTARGHGANLRKARQTEICAGWSEMPVFDVGTGTACTTGKMHLLRILLPPTETENQ